MDRETNRSQAQIVENKMTLEETHEELSRELRRLSEAPTEYHRRLHA